MSERIRGIAKMIPPPYLSFIPTSSHYIMEGWGQSLHRGERRMFFGAVAVDKNP
jgi:hypothetical protein